MRRALLVRHGESELGARGLVDGDPKRRNPLTASGREQARGLGERLAAEPIDVCVTSQLERARETADVALAGRAVQRLVVAELDEIDFGRWDGLPFAEYAAWAWSAGPAEPAPGGGESRDAVAARFAAGWRRVLELPHEVVLVVAHGLPVRYAVDAAQGLVPAQRAEPVALAEPHELSEPELRLAAETLEAWAREPVWRAD